MTDRTPNRGYIFPECEPPLVKDASDIVYLRDLAEQVNADAGNMDAAILDLWEKPDSARISFSGNLVSNGAVDGQTIRFPYDTVTFDNTAGSTLVGSNALRVLERGWYLVVSSVRCTNGAAGTEQNFVIRTLRNGLGSEQGRRFEGITVPVTIGGESTMQCSDVILCQVGDALTTQVKNFGVAGTFNWDGHITMVQMLKLDV